MVRSLWTMNSFWTPSQIFNDSLKFSGDLKDDGSDQSYLMKSNEKGLNSGVKDPDAYVNAYSYEEIANILFGKWALIINNLCILFYLFSCQCSYMTLIKVIY